MTEPTEQASTYTVLFVDDEPNILRAIKRALHYGYYATAC